jgi:uncharacterized protein (TIRG00374 family)
VTSRDTHITHPGRIQAKRFALPVSISLATLGALAFAVDGDFWDVLGSADPMLLMLAALKAPALVLLWALRWHLVLRARLLPVRFGQTVKATLVRTFFNNLTPGVGTGGEPAAAWFLAKRVPMPFKEAVASTAAERMIQSLALALIVAITFACCLPMLPVASGPARLVMAGLGVFAGSSALVLYLSVFRFHSIQGVLEWLVRAAARIVPSIGARLSRDRIRTGIVDFHRAYRAFLRSPRASVGIFLTTAIHWGIDIVQHSLLFWALHTEVELWTVLVTATAVKVLSTFSILPGGSGMVEGINFGLYAALTDLPESVILSETLLFRALDTWTLWMGSAIGTGIVSTSVTSDAAGVHRRESVPDQGPSVGAAAACLEVLGQPSHPDWQVVPAGGRP